jgi:putative ABC transport system ATP-binding protein
MERPIIELRDVARRYGRGESAATALHPISCSIERGEWVALLGPSGSGKSTLLNLIGGIDTADEGAVIVDGENLTQLSPHALAAFRRRRLSFIFQAFHLLPSLTVFDNVAVPLTLDHRLDAAGKAKIRDALDRLGVGALANRYPDQLSGGQQQRVAIARAIVHEPAVLLADEPTGNLDRANGLATLDLLQSLNRERGMTIVMATHSADAAARCGRALELEDGRLASAIA